MLLGPKPLRTAHNVRVINPRQTDLLRHTTRRSVQMLTATLLAALLAGACGGQPSSEATNTPPASTAQPPAPAAPATPPPSYYVYVTNEASGDLSVIDPNSRTVAVTIPLGKRPRG